MTREKKKKKTRLLGRAHKVLAGDLLLPQLDDRGPALERLTNRLHHRPARLRPGVVTTSTTTGTRPWSTHLPVLALQFGSVIA